MLSLCVCSCAHPKQPRSRTRSSSHSHTDTLAPASDDSLSSDAPRQRRRSTRLSPAAAAALTTADYLAVYPARGVAVKLVYDAVKGLCVLADQRIAKGMFVMEYAGELLTKAQGEARNAMYADMANDVGSYMFWIWGETACIDATNVLESPVNGASNTLSVPSSSSTVSSSSSADVARSSTATTAPEAAAATAAVDAAAATPATTTTTTTPASFLPPPLSPSSSLDLTTHEMRFGFGRFMNHSFQHNLTPRLKNGNSRDHAAPVIAPSSGIGPALCPRLCFFASRVIEKGEELTILYGDMSRNNKKDFPFLKRQKKNAKTTVTPKQQRGQ